VAPIGQSGIGAEPYKKRATARSASAKSGREITS
jgi:hypothetical protein